MLSAAVLCARKGSTRLPGKHHLLIDGLPIWQFAARAMVDAKQDGAVDHLLVSTDDRDILPRAMEMGLFPVLRPAELCGGKSSIHSALVHAISIYECEAQLCGKIEAAAFIPANVPTVTGRLIGACFETLKRHPKATSAITVALVSQHPEWMWTPSPRSLFLRRCSASQAYRMQDLPHRYIATGSCQVVRRKVIMGCKSGRAFEWLGKRVLPVVDPDAVEIHDQQDYLLAKAVIEAGGPRA